MKKLISILVVLLIAILLVACGTTKKPEDTVVEFCTSLKNFDPQAILECFVNSEENAFDMLIFESDQPEINAMLDKFKNWAAYMNFKVVNGTVDGDTATVPVEFTYVNMAPIVDEAVEEYRYEAIDLAMLSEEVTYEDMTNLMLEILAEKTSTVPDDRITKTIEFKLVKDGREWKLDYFDAEVSDAVIDVMTCNMRESVEKYS